MWTRDEARCGFVGEDGHRCNETRGLEFAHRHPWGKSGANTPINLGLRCQAHNALEAERDYGASHMASKRNRKPLQVREPVARYSVRRRPMDTGIPGQPVPGCSIQRTPQALRRARYGSEIEQACLRVPASRGSSAAERRTERL